MFSQNLHAAPTAELVADAESGRILLGENINSLRHPASLTKVMTLYLTFAAIEQGRLKMNTRLPVSFNASTQPPSRLGLDEGGSISVRDAVYGLVTESANDAAIVLAEAIGGSEDRFARMMTQQARALGMKRTVYRNPNGLPDDEQVTTAFDQAILARAMLYHFPDYYKLFRTRVFSYDGVAHKNHNHLMGRYEGMDGIKTGYIRASGFNLMASAKRGGRRLVAIVFGGRTAKSRDNRVADILDYGFDRVFAEAKSGRAVATNVSTTTDGADVTTQPNAAMEPVSRVAEGDENASSSDDNNWAVQVGSFDDQKQGQKAITRAKKLAPKHLKNAKSKIVKARKGKKTVYRARVSGLDEDTARKACQLISNSGQTCLTVPPRG